MFDLSKITALVVAPHPDDEVFGPGGLIHKIKRARGKVYVLYVTVGLTLDFSSRGKSDIAHRQCEMTRAADILGIDDYDLVLPGNDYHLKLDSRAQAELIGQIERYSKLSIENTRPNLLLTPSISDYNQDHRAMFRACITALRPASTQFKHYVANVLSYELPYHQWQCASTGQQESPNFYVPLDEQDMNIKLKALSVYESQLKAPDSPLSLHGVRSLAAYRGLQCANPWAEAYSTLRLSLS